MMLPWFGVIVDRDTQPDKIASYRPGDFDGRIPHFGPAKPDVVRPGLPVVQPAILRTVKKD